MATYGDKKDQRGDVLILNTSNGGEMGVDNGEVTMTVFLYTAVYATLFGGNSDDSVGDDEKFSWWGNRDETESVMQYRSKTEYLLQSLPANSANLKLVEEAVLFDLQWLLEKKVASGVSVGVGLTGPKRIRIIVVIEAYGEKKTFEFTENWEAYVEEETPDTFEVEEILPFAPIFQTLVQS